MSKQNIIFTVVGAVAISVGLTFAVLSVSGVTSGLIKSDAEAFAEVLFSKEVREAMQKAQVKQKEVARKEAEEAMKQKIDEQFKNPKKPKLSESRAFFGPKNAPITIVEYSDFQCPYCATAHRTLKKVKETYGDKVRVLYKHLPLSFHKYAKTAAIYYEAVALQGADKAEKFHDYLFENQRGLSASGSEKGAEDFLKKAVKEVGANLSQVSENLKSKKLINMIDEDIQEASQFGFQGTPAFLINGVGFSGARGIESFKEIIDRHLKSL